LPVTLRDFQLREKGPSVFVMGHEENGMALLRTANVPGEQICFAFYATCGTAMFEFNRAEALVSLPVLDGVVYFWVGERPESPDKKMARLEQSVAQLEHGMYKLQLTSQSAAAAVLAKTCIVRLSGPVGEEVTHSARVWL
jgi:hypothetical protein